MSLIDSVDTGVRGGRDPDSIRWDLMEMEDVTWSTRSWETHNVYSIGKSEEILGRALKNFANRDVVVIATKLHGKMREGPNGEGCRARRS